MEGINIEKIIDIINRDFPEDKRTVVIKCLSSINLSHVMGKSEYNLEKTLLSILYLAKGNVSEVEELTKQAKIDFRDVIYWATLDMDETVKIKKARALEAESWKDSKKMKRLWLKTAAILEDVIKQNPNNAVALTNLGAIYSNLARYKEALDLLKKARKLNFSDRNLYYNMGVVSVNLMRNREAKKYFTISSALEANEWTFAAYIDFQAL